MRLVILALLVPAGLAGLVLPYDTLGGRIRDLEERAQTAPGERAVLDERFDELDREFGSLRDRVARSAADQDLEGRLTQVETLLSAAEAGLFDVECELAENEDQLAQALTRQQDAELLAELRREVDSLRTQLDERWGSLNEVVTGTAAVADAGLRRMESLEANLPASRDTRTMWRELVGPTIQLAGQSTVGSGVVVRGTDGALHVLTAWHVVRDIKAENEGVVLPIPLRAFRRDGSWIDRECDLIAHDVDLDVALLTVVDPEGLEEHAQLATPNRLDDVQVFDTIYAVGCPLGNDPIPTHGEVASTYHLVGDNAYWMISAPTYIGNSGGGIYDAATHELLGIFSKIYTHGSMRATIVPHMGLVTPLDQIYDWLGRQGHLHLFQSEETVRLDDGR